MNLQEVYEVCEETYTVLAGKCVSVHTALNIQRVLIRIVEDYGFIRLVGRTGSYRIFEYRGA